MVADHTWNSDCRMWIWPQVEEEVISCLTQRHSVVFYTWTKLIEETLSLIVTLGKMGMVLGFTKVTKNHHTHVYSIMSYGGTECPHSPIQSSDLFSYAQPADSKNCHPHTGTDPISEVLTLPCGHSSQSKL